MTTNPQFCVPGDTALRAAEIMRDYEVGPVPVVASHDDRRVVGIVTDRDLTVRLIAAGRAPEVTTVSDVMTSNPIECNDNDDVETAMSVMSRQQVRRVPVVNNNGELVGIIAQADIARFVDEERAGEVVEDISQPGHNAVGRAYGRVGHAVRAWSGGNTGGMLIAVALGAAIGAGIMAAVDERRR